MQERTGIVKNNTMKMTIAVKVERRWFHPIYGKVMKRSKIYLAHDPLGAAVGDRVRIRETRPLSKRKRWIVVERIEKTKKAIDKEKANTRNKREGKDGTTAKRTQTSR